jgi:hypothetical protein
MKLNLELKKNQTKAIIEATDLNSRLISGQLDDLIRLVPMSKSIDREKARNLIKELKKTLFPELSDSSSYGIFNTNLDDKAKTLYDIHQAVRYVYSWHITPEGSFQTWFTEPFQSSSINPLPKVTIIDSKINYEFHLTIKDVNKDDFINYCKEINVKPILLQLQNNKNVVVLNDTMTSHHKLLSNDKEAFEELQRVKSLLVEKGFKVIREKIEADINHPDLTETFLIDNNSNYFETHFNIRLSEERRELLQNIALKYSCHFSRNIFKQINDKEYTIMLTYRKYTGTILEFQEDLSKIEADLKNNSFSVEKIIVEYSIYDSQEDWDKKWLESIQE